ncbi:WxL domain-containing protein [Enterococcus mundtii]|uniref:WxL domain-containing protein n=2 Tax=Enterococcus mundtii TaxID=53346 RepID=A0ABQ0VCS2_ENTMU|nr:WxL domain-containing protein [Enterococcus mundtii]AUB51694.1 hypothetical protein EM4838_01320 [Enterococcus mundtii]MDB7087014.1 WxL domain-containing protein [Enterococcus mundtii]GEL80239.1 hypothetical protein EMU01_13830 [Enterococcus mundtii]GEN18201.1 hypothetical protein LAC02_14820 [Ligilactobacillus acidipiscis]
MPSRLRRTMLFLGTTILVIQTVTIPLGMVYAETTMDNVEHEPMERPAIQNSLKELSSNPNFFFSQSQLQGTIKVPLQVTFFSDQEVSEARVILPEEATLIQDQLSAGISIEQGEQPHEWIVHSKHAQNTFVLPLVFDKIGNYELSVEETTTQLKISEPEAISDELPAEESDSPDDELGGQKESKEGEYIIEENQEDDQTSEEVDEPKEEAPQDQQTKEKEPFVSVSTWEEFQKAISNDDVQKIILENDIVRNAGSAGTINRNIEIDGQGWSIDFANNTAGFTLGAVSVETTITLKNITITKPGTTAIFTGTAANSQRWTLNFENVHTGSGNVSGLVNAPNAKAGYIGGENTYRSTMNGRDDAVFRVNKFFARNGSKVSMDLQAKLAQISGVLPVVQITDEDTTVSINTTSTSSGRNGGVIRFDSNESLIEVNNGASLKIEAPQTSALLYDTATNSRILVDNGSKMELYSSRLDGNDATVRFYGAASRGSRFDIDNNSTVIIEAEEGAAPAVRFRADGQFFVKGNSKLQMYNGGNGSPNNSANQGIEFANDGGVFDLSGVGTEVNIVSDFGPAIGGNSSMEINVREGTSFTAIGRSSTASGAIFNGSISNITIDNPLFFDFKNTRPNGGNIYSVSASSIFDLKNSNFAAWTNGSNFDLEAEKYWNMIDFELTGSNFNTIRQTSDPESFNTSTFGPAGMTAYSRISANNARAVVDELRVPTNADKSIFGHVSIPEGSDYRSAFEGEVELEIEIERLTGEKETHRAVTKVDSIYGEADREGIFEVKLPELLNEGDRISVLSAFRGVGEVGVPSLPDDIKIDSVVVFPIIPPKPAEFPVNIIEKTATHVQGYVENKEVEITATHNGQIFDTSDVTVDDEGNFILNLSDLTLKEDDEIQVFLRDAEGSAEAAGVINPPETNNARGNINPAADLTFHDVTFEPATTLIVEDVGPFSPVDPLDPELEVEPENKPELPEDQGQLSIDFISSFNFGSQAISVHEQTYYAQPQRLLNEDGTVKENEERPNYVQISDRRPDNGRSGWQLSVTQNGQFSNQNGHELIGSEIQLLNQELVTAQGGTAPALKEETGQKIIPNTKRILLQADEKSGTGTWIYRFGNAETADKSVGLYVPKGTNPEAKEYSTTLTWELSSVPENQ